MHTQVLLFSVVCCVLVTSASAQEIAGFTLIDAISDRDIRPFKDGDTLSYEWKFYPEAETYLGQVDIENANNMTTSLVVPEDASGAVLHMLLVLTDNGFPLCR